MMTESDIIIKLDSDDERTNIKNSQSPVSRSSTPSNTVKAKRTRLTFPFGACRVCSDSATGVHYGIATCEGCKGFFKRSILRKEKYRCYFDSLCLIDVNNRNRCKSCRFRRCVTEGMSIDGVRMGRIPKLVKERALREQKEQQMQQKAPVTESNDRSDEGHVRESSCSSLSDRSIENYDPNAMETDIIKLHTSSTQRQSELSKTHKNTNVSQTNYLIDSFSPDDQIIKLSRMESNLSEYDMNFTTNIPHKKISSMMYRTSYPIYLPDDFTLDETQNLTDHSTGPLSDEIFKHIQSISTKLSQNKSDLFVELTDDESKFIRFLRWSSYNIHLRHSKRVKQLEIRMDQMIYNGIHEYPGDNATHAQFFASVPKTLEVIVRASVFYIQELPGMTNMNSNNLHKMILHRSFDWYMLKYGCLLNENGQCYFLSPDGLQYTRYWMNSLYGADMTDAMFEFSQYFRELNLNESEIALVLPLQMCYPDSTMEDQERPRMLRACYLYGLYEELCHNRGEQEGKLICSKILQVLDLLIYLNEYYEKNVGPRLLEA